MAHRGISRHHQLSRPEVEGDTADHNPKLSVLKRQQTGDPMSEVASTMVDATNTRSQPPENPPNTMSNTKTGQTQTTIPTTSPAPTAPTASTASATPTASGGSTNTSLLSLSLHSPDPSSLSLTLTTDAPSLTGDLSSTARATSSAVQSSTQISHTPSGTTAASSTSTISSNTRTPTAAPSSSEISSPSSSAGTNSLASTAGTSPSATFSDASDPTGFVGGFSGAGGGIPSVSGTGASAAPSATDTQPPQDSGPSPTTNKIVGGVVGSVAGIAFVFLIVLLYFRRRHAALREARQGLPPGDVSGGAAGEGSVSRSAEMTSRRSSNDPLFSASYFAPAFMKHWRKSNQTTNTDSTLASSPSERGFQKISGRKIPSVLQSGGDGYGGGFCEASPDAEMSVNFQPAYPGHLRTPTSQPPTATPHGNPLDANYTQESRELDPGAVLRPSPARTPVASSVNGEPTRVPTLVPTPRSTPEPQNTSSSVSSPAVPKRPDLLGRSHPSHDGSRSSRFTEGV